MLYDYICFTLLKFYDIFVVVDYRAFMGNVVTLYVVIYCLSKLSKKKQHRLIIVIAQPTPKATQYT